MKKYSLFLAVIFVLFGTATSNALVQVTVLEPITFTRGTGESVTETVIFPGLIGTATVKLWNGNLHDDLAERVSSSIVTVNGQVVFGSSEFNQNVGYLEKETNLSEGQNILEVLLKGKPGGQVTIQIMQDFDAEAAAVIGPEGGTVEVVNDDSPLHGMSVEFPSGSVPEGTIVTIGLIEDAELPNKNTLIGAVSSIRTTQPLQGYMQVQLPITEQVGVDEQVVIYAQDDGGGWDVIPSVFVEGSFVKYETTHFSYQYPTKVKFDPNAHELGKWRLLLFNMYKSVGFPNFVSMEANLVDMIYHTLNYQRFENATTNAARVMIGTYTKTINPFGILSAMNSAKGFADDVTRSAYDDEKLSEGYLGLLLCSLEGMVNGGAPGVIASCGNEFMLSVFDMVTRFAAVIVTNGDFKKINNINIANDYLTLYYMYGTDVDWLADQEGLLPDGLPIPEDDVIEGIAKKYKKGFFDFDDYDLDAIYDMVEKTRSWIENLAEVVDKDTDGILDDGDASGTPGDNPCIGGNTENCDDNCPNTYNPDQADSDGDGIGDECDMLDFPVTFPDPNLERAIRWAIGKPTGAIMYSDLSDLRNLSLTCSYCQQIHNIEGLQYCRNLQKLKLYQTAVSDISPLKSLVNLTSLSLTRNQISDINPLKSLVNLTSLSLWEKQISDINPLATLVNLTYLNSSLTQISDISPLESLVNLTDLGLYNSQVSDISALSSLVNLKYLTLGVNRQLTDVTPISCLAHLTHLGIVGSPITDITPISTLTGLISLSLDCSTGDITPLSSLVNLTRLHLHNSGHVTDLAPLSSLVNLTQLSLWGQIRDITPLSSLVNLTRLYLTGNQITDINPLSSLINLTELSLSWNSITDLAPLVDNAGIGVGDTIALTHNPLDATSCTNYIPLLKARGASVTSDCPPMPE